MLPCHSNHDSKEEVMKCGLKKCFSDLNRKHVRQGVVGEGGAAAAPYCSESAPQHVRRM